MEIAQDCPEPTRAAGPVGVAKLAAIFLVIIACSLPAFAAQTSAPADAPLDPLFGISTIPLGEGPDAATLTCFRPQPGTGNGTSVIIAPGGAYVHWAMNLEGRQVADWFTVRGVTAFVLKYRLGPKNLYPAPLEDAQHAIRLVRSLADEYQLAPDRVGFMGFSAGGHLAAATGTLFHEAQPGATDPLARWSDRPDFLILGYPWLNAMQPNDRGLITYCGMMNGVTQGTCNDPEAYDQQYTPARHVTRKTPPTFIYITSDDAVVSVPAVINFYNALYEHGVSTELHIFRSGAHGSGLGGGDRSLDQWPMLLENWLRDLNLLSAAPGSAKAQAKPKAVATHTPEQH